VNQTGMGHTENGTGPFMLDHWTAGQELVLKANPNYWRTDPAWDGGPTGVPALKKVTIQVIKGASARMSAVKSGSADTIGLYTTGKDTKLDVIAGETCDIQGKCTPTSVAGSSIRVYNNLPSTTRMDALFNYQVEITGGNPLLGSGQLDGAGIPPNFFTDVHIRQAFSYCFNWDAYITQALGGQGRQLTQVMMPGEIGADPNNPHYQYNPQACADAFKATVWKATNGASLWDTGFHMNIAFNPRLPDSQIFSEILSQGVSAVNDKFVIQVTNQPWEVYTDNYRNKRLPILFATSREVLADPHNWADLMTIGNLGSGLQRMPLGMKYQFQYLVDKGVQTTDPAVRAQIYQQFNQLYYQNASAILLAQALDKRYEQRWVSGYYFNPMYADLYYYVLSKQ
jgi:peptide/nickel transport system substrate-binding protein